MSAFEACALALASFLIGMALGTYTTSKEWDEICKLSAMNGKRWRLMFLEMSEKYWRTQAIIGPEPFCTETADQYKAEADELRPKVTP